ncbi:MAG: S24 family peptidase [Burkholderiales bacterium]|jgi:SOS-response transcriptional repressor LexA|nr:S24 family peptidase [Burkholderiales bacterium]
MKKKDASIIEIYETRRKRLRLWIDTHHGGVQARFVDTTGINQGELSSLLKQCGKTFGEEKARPLEKAAGMPILWLDQDDGSNNTVDADHMFWEVPLISWVQAGDWANVLDSTHPSAAEEMVRTTYKPKRYTYALRVRGSSMTNPNGSPSFPEGTIVIVEPEADALPGKFVVIRQNGDESTFKRLDKDGGSFYLTPLNPQFPIMKMEEDAVFCGVVMEAITRFY